MYLNKPVHCLRRRALLLSALTSTLPAIVSCGGGDSATTGDTTQEPKALEFAEGKFALKFGDRATAEVILHLESLGTQTDPFLTSAEIFTQGLDIIVFLSPEGIPSRIINRGDQTVFALRSVDGRLETRQYNNAGDFINGGVIYSTEADTFRGVLLNEFNSSVSDLSQKTIVDSSIREIFSSLISAIDSLKNPTGNDTIQNRTRIAGFEKLQRTIAVDPTKFSYFSDALGPKSDGYLQDFIKSALGLFDTAVAALINAVVLYFLVLAVTAIIVLIIGASPTLLKLAAINIAATIVVGGLNASASTPQTLPLPMLPLQPNGLPYGWRVGSEGLTGDFNFNFTLTLISNDRTRRIGYDGVCGDLGGCSLFIDDSIDLTDGVITSGTDVWRLTEAGSVVVNPETDPYNGIFNKANGSFTFPPETEVTDVTPPDSQISYTQISEFLFDATLNVNTGTISGTVTQRLSTTWSYDASIAVIEVIYAYEGFPR